MDVRSHTFSLSAHRTLSRSLSRADECVDAAALRDEYRVRSGTHVLYGAATGSVYRWRFVFVRGSMFATICSAPAAKRTAFAKLHNTTDTKLVSGCVLVCDTRHDCFWVFGKSAHTRISRTSVQQQPAMTDDECTRVA